jgi:hypothetical protein
LDSFNPANAQTATAILTNCTFQNNLASGDAGAVGNGGAIDNLGEKTTMTVVGCAISNNRSVGGGGFGSQGIGGGLLNGGGSILNVVGCAITKNLALGGDNANLSKDNPYASGRRQERTSCGSNPPANCFNRGATVLDRACRQQSSLRSAP